MDEMKHTKSKNWGFSIKPRTLVNRNNSINISISSQDVEKLMTLLNDIKVLLTDRNTDKNGKI